MQGKHIYLREMTLEDTAQIIQWRNSAEVQKHFIYQQPFTEEGHRHWFRTMIESGKAVQYIICLLEEEKPVGSVYLRDIDYVNKKAEFGIFLEGAAQGRGIGTEAAELIVEHGFNVLGLHKIFLRVLADNLRARKSYEKIGFQEEGYFKDDCIIGGDFIDIVMMAIFPPNSI